MSRTALQLRAPSVHAALTRAQAPTAEGARDVNAALLDALATEMESLRTEIKALKYRVSYLEGAHEP